jgi:hypothetical protein
LAEDFGGLASTCPDEAIFLLPWPHKTLCD